ncbi:hypothetical protein GOBAR_AA17055 [Gossypium barbadense]|uniref:Uncharacterized protein n=1 Tax=Gossypium barbadense TaxID=3634 RepID=A0A2P5XJS2_GOSBA|nr:hypothetical protein GOBAR_AA17055 [Gossypium barbadense]
MNWTRGWWWLSRWVLVLWGEIIRNVLVGLLLSRLGETILGREPEVSRQSSHVGANGDDPLPMPLRLVLNCEGDEVGKPSAAPNSGCLAGRLTHLGKTAPCRDHHSSSLRSGDRTLSIVPSRCSGPQLKVGPEVARKVLPGAHGETVGRSNEFSRLDPQKMMLPSISWKQG